MNCTFNIPNLQYQGKLEASEKKSKTKGSSSMWLLLFKD